MTIPVTQSTKIDRAGPVTQSNEDAKTVMQFFTPAQYEEETVPQPTNPNVNIVSLPETYFGVFLFSGFASRINFEIHSLSLKKTLDKEGIEITGSLIKATYNSQFIPPYLGAMK